MRHESTQSLKIALCLLFTWQLAACTSTGAPKTTRTECPPACGLDVSLPKNQDSMPAVPSGQMVIHVRHGALMAIALKDHGAQPAKAATKLVFKDETPFVDSKGKLRKVIVLDPEKTTLVQVRSDLPKCGRSDKKDECDKDGYRFKFKYNIENDGNSRRPVRDPWIIIER